MLSVLPCAHDPKPLFEAGTSHARRGGIKAQAALLPFEGLLARPRLLAGVYRRALPGDYVPGVGRPPWPSPTLTVRKEAGTALGPGNRPGSPGTDGSSPCLPGVSPRSKPRALNFAGFNARLNGLSNIELRKAASMSRVESGQLRFDCEQPAIRHLPAAAISLPGWRPGGRSDLREGGSRAAALLREGGFRDHPLQLAPPHRE